MAINLLEGKVVAPEGMRVGIVASRFNSFIVQKLLDGAVDARIADAPLIEGAVAAAVEASCGSSIEEVVEAAEAARGARKL